MERGSKTRWPLDRSEGVDVAADELAMKLGRAQATPAAGSGAQEHAAMPTDHAAAAAAHTHTMGTCTHHQHGVSMCQHVSVSRIRTP